MPNGGKAIGTLYGVPKLPHIICHAKRSIGASSSAHILARDPRQLAAQITGRYGRDGIFSGELPLNTPEAAALAV